MIDLPLVSRATPLSLRAPLIPLDFSTPGLSLDQVGALVWAYRRVTLAIIAIGVALSVLAMAFWPRTYTGTALLMVSYEVNDPQNGKELPVNQVSSYIATQVELMRTREVLIAVADRLGLADRAEYRAGYSARRGTLRDWVAAKMARDLVIFQGNGGNQLIYVTYEASTPGEAAEVANAVVDAYKAGDFLRAAAPPGQRAALYSAQLAGLKLKVDEAQGVLTAFRQRTGLVDDGTNAAVGIELLASQEEKLLIASAERRAAAGRAGTQVGTTDAARAAPQVQLLQTQLDREEAQLAQLNYDYMPGYPPIARMNEQVAGTRRALRSALQAVAANADGNLSSARRSERELRTAVSVQRAQVMADARLRDESARYQLALESAKAVYRRALEGYDQVVFSAGGNRNNVSLVSSATPPVKPTRPRVVAGLVLGGALSVLLGLAGPFAWELLHRRVRCRDDLERDHGLPVLAEFGAAPVGGVT